MGKFLEFSLVGAFVFCYVFLVYSYAFFADILDNIYKEI